MPELKNVQCIGLLLIVILSGCTSQKADTSSLEGLKELKGKEVRTASANSKHFRQDAVKETAITVGAQSGLAWQANNINEILETQSKILDRIFNFQPMLLENNILSPVLVESRDILDLQSDNSIRIADRTFLILKQARFVSAAPNWREYLWMGHTPPDKPDNTLLPQNRSERTIWKQGISEGWKHGIEQANAIFKENISRLTQDFQGMILYRKLLAQKMVTPPHIAETDLGVTGDNNKLRVNDKILRISALPELLTNSKSWKPVVQRP